MVFDTAGGELPDGARVVSIAAEAPGATYFIVEPNGEQLRELSQLAEAGYVEPVIDSVFPLTHVQAAFNRVGERGKRGKVVLEIGNRRHA